MDLWSLSLLFQRKELSMLYQGVSQSPPHQVPHPALNRTFKQDKMLWPDNCTVTTYKSMYEEKSCTVNSRFAAPSLRVTCWTDRKLQPFPSSASGRLEAVHAPQPLAVRKQLWEHSGIGGYTSAKAAIWIFIDVWFFLGIFWKGRLHLQIHVKVSTMHRTVEYPKLEVTYKGHQSNPWLHRELPKILCLRALSSCFLNSVMLELWSLPWGARSMPDHTLVRNLYLISKLTLTIMAFLHSYIPIKRA